LAWGVLLYSPVLLLARAAVPQSVWLIIAVSAALEVAYFLFIARAYRLGDLSMVYPLARGTAPLFLLLLTALSLFGVSDHLSALGAAGVVLIATGLYILNLPRLGAWLAPLGSLARPAPQAAVLAGLCISLYTLADRAGVQQLDPLLYTYLVI